MNIEDTIDWSTPSGCTECGGPVWRPDACTECDPGWRLRDEPRTREEAEAHVRRWRRQGLLPADIDHLLPVVVLQDWGPVEPERSHEWNAQGSVCGHDWGVSVLEIEGDKADIRITWDRRVIADFLARCLVGFASTPAQVAEELSQSILRDHIRNLHAKEEL